MEKSDEPDERQTIRQSFPFQSFPVNTFPMKATINSSKFCSSMFLTFSIHQISSDFSTVKVLHYMVHMYIHNVCLYIRIYNIGASLSEPHHTIWPLEMVPWPMRETDTIKNGVDRRTCRPL